MWTILRSGLWPSDRSFWTKLAEEITKTGGSWRHIHLIAYSSGCWAISEAAKILARKTKADVHLTFFDAYIPASWQEGSLGNIDAGPDVNCWIEHYYTRDLTMSWTQQAGSEKQRNVQNKSCNTRRSY